MRASRGTVALVGLLGALAVAVAVVVVQLKKPDGSDATGGPSSLQSEATASTPQPPGAELRPVEWVELLGRLRDQGRSEELLAHVALLEQSQPTLLGANDLYTLAGDTARDTKDLERALRLYRLAERFDSPLADTILLRQIEVLAELGQGKSAEETLERLLVLRPAARYEIQARLAIAAAWSKASDLPHAEQQR